MTQEGCLYCKHNLHKAGVVSVCRWQKHVGQVLKVGPLWEEYCKCCEEGKNLQRERELKELLTGKDSKYDH